MTPRAPAALADFTAALGDRSLASLAALAGHTRLSDLGVAEQQLPGVAATVTAHPLIANTPQPPSEQELLELLRKAL
jgi:alcohol dehydrogenase class IV